MGLLVGDVAGFGPSTWGALRSVIYDGDLSPLDDGGPHNAGYAHGYKTTEGNGLIRTDLGYLYQSYGTADGPNFFISASGPYPYLLAQFGSNQATSASGYFVNEDRAQLIGETVTFTGGTVTMTSDAFDYPYYQIFANTGVPNPLISIGKLTAF